MTDSIVILGAGIAGLGASLRLQESSVDHTIYEKQDSWGGICNSFKVKGFTFDRAIHLSFSEDEKVKEIFKKSSEFYKHNPESLNYYKSLWIRHPVQTNLYKLDSDLKLKILNDFIENRATNETQAITNYKDWLVYQFGKVFTEDSQKSTPRNIGHYHPKIYVLLGLVKGYNRPKTSEVLEGAVKECTDNKYYAKEMRYPHNGGYKSFLTSMVNESCIKTNKEVASIDYSAKIINFSDGCQSEYSQLISSLPLPTMIKLSKGCPEAINKEANELLHTSVCLVSIGLNRVLDVDKLWFYVYDEHILASRSLLSSLEKPSECSVKLFVHFNLKSIILELSLLNKILIMWRRLL